MKALAKSLPIFLASATWLAAEIVIYEPFDYPSTGTDGDEAYLGDGSQSGALGLDGAWSQVINNIEMEVLEGGMEFSDVHGNVLPVTGNSILRSARQGTAVMASSVSSEAISALTADGTTMWMSFLYVDTGFSGPDSSVTLASEPLADSNDHSLNAAGYGVGIVIGEPSGGVNATVDAAYYLDATAPTVSASTLNPNDSENEVFLFAAKINWNEDGTEDEIFVFNITDLSAEPAEEDAISSNTFDMLQADQAMLDTLNIGETQVDGFDEIRIGTTFADVIGGTLFAAPTLTLSISPSETTEGSYDFTWESKPNYLYDLVSSTDLSTSPDAWDAWDGRTGIVATEAETTLTDIPGGEDSSRFFAVLEMEPPALLDVDFESDNGGFTASVTEGTLWEWGAPNSIGFGGSITAGNGGSLNAWGVGLNGAYAAPTTDSCLRSPDIDLSGFTQAELTFAEALDVEGSDTAELKLFNADGDVEIATVYTATDGSLATADWAEANGGQPIDLSAGAGLTVYLQWCLSGVGGTTADYLGWYIDDVVVEGSL
ncbi:MAG: hypothetical protein Q7Q71_04200 [Verrucomicrobiota bacterium JB023]|nr:hypothetical protein [Verrucomicrobiota bacterium JB023]